MPTNQPDDSIRRIPIELTLEEAFSGLERELSVEQPTRCRACSGTGRTGRTTRCPQCRGRGRVARDSRASIGRPGSRRCPRCEGSGTVSASQCAICDGDGTRWQETAVSVDVPPGIEDGQGLRVTAGADQQPIAILEVTIEPHERYDRTGTDLSCEHAVAPGRARAGETIEIETLDGDVQFEVPPGTETGDRFRFEGKGMPALDGDERGDLYVTIVLEDDTTGRSPSQSNGVADPDEGKTSSEEAAIDPDRDTPGPPTGRRGGPRAQTRASDTSTERDGNLAVESDDGGPLANERPADERATKEPAESTLEAYESRIEALESALESTQAEFRAYKDRVETRQERRDKQAAASLLERFVEVREDLERAVEADSDDGAGVKEGVELTLRRFDRILEDEGVSRIDPEPGTPVDPHRHEVMHRVEGDQPAGTVSSVYTRGYELDDRVIRPARVSVSQEA
ncbi:nucleotide exchange factor GrpE [Natrialbaceae archaeon A-CW2]|uniref:nucleotide exchange factor GrpE n=1 Tax=Natronosalvus amylolyticus TaxID=2961994 RepID=UPI0020C96A79|nr:nucleotide exchange factor GrpE [Natronosalvus amylolyticus]